MSSPHCRHLTQSISSEMIGEIDVVEGISTYSANQATIHTNPGCSIPSTSASALGITGTLVAQTDCSAADTGNQGCGMRSASNVSFGAAFNGAADVSRH
jgi:hypothetical protein